MSTWPNSVGRMAVKLAQAAALAGAVFVLAWLCITLTRQSGRVAAIWPVNGIVLACLLRADARRWPALLAAAYLGNLGANLACRDALITAMGLSACNSLEIVICALGLRKAAGPRLDLRQWRDLWLFVGICGLLAPLISGTAASLVLGVLARSDPQRAWATWVLSDSLGLLVVVPPLLLLRRSSVVRMADSPRMAANILALLALAATVTLVFGQSRVPLLFLIPSALVLVTFQMEMTGAALGVLITATISAAMASLGLGPQVLLGADILRQMVALQVVLVVCAATALPIGATLAGRRRDRVLLAASEARYRLLADKTTDLIILLGADGRISYASPSIRLYGYEPEEVVGRSTLDFVHPDDQARAAEVLRSLFMDQPVDAAVRREYRVATKGGDYVWLEGNPTVLRDEAGRPTQAATNYRDVTARRALEDELLAAKAAAEAAAEAKSEFLANMSHEIRTPLTGVIGFAELLGETAGLSDEAQWCVRRISSASHSLLAVVNDVLDFSKLEAGQLELDPHPFDPAEFTREVVEIVASQAREKDLRLEVRIDPAMPPFVLADSARLRQVLLNLLSNAVKFTAAGQVTVSVSHTSEPAPRLRFEVADTGPGVAADRLDRLFQRFSQVDGSISRQYGGSGLGLAICRKLTGLMGGRIGVDSQEGVGSNFWFEIAAPASEAPASLPAVGPTFAEDRPATILIVDDVAVNRELVRAMLTPLGHDCVEAASGAEALDLLARSSFDLIIMDLQMPGMDGLAATRAIRAMGGEHETTPILALSANVLPQHVAACDEAGMDDHIAKPIRAAELVTKVHQWLAAGRTPELADARTA